MSYVLVEKLTKTIHDKTLLNEVTFAINKGEKIALVAQNGSGKSTLLNVITEKISHDAGRISKQNGISWSFLEQNPELDSELTIEEAVLPIDSPIVNAIKLYETALENPNDNDAMQEAFDEMNKYDAWEYEKQIQEVMKKLKLNELTGKVGTLSGGQQKRVALAKAIIDNPDFLILDEPTNHLDLEMIDWLEEYLSSKEITLFIVTHDRYFLDKVCNQILELSRGKIYKHKGNYSYYLEQKELRETNENINIDKTKAFLKKELEWVRTQPQARQTKASARVDAYYDKANNLGQRNVTEKVQLDSTERRLGARILELHNVNKSFGDTTILKDFNYEFSKGEKVGIIGKNGVGKTTFLNLIMGRDEANSGKIVTGETVRFGYYTQHQQELNPNETVLDSIRKLATSIKLSNGSEILASKLLERFLFTPIAQRKLVGDLSGGEKKRVHLLQILIKNPNFLILDEPTNDFDLMTLEVLAKFLKAFKGSLIVISHDRYFMDSVIDHLFIFKGDGEIQNFPGNYSQYRETQPTSHVTPVPETVVDPVSKSKKSNKQAHDLYKKIEKLEKKKVKLGEKIIELGSDYEEVAEVAKKIKSLDMEIEEKTEEWMEIS